MSQPTPPVEGICEPSICGIVQGRKRVHLSGANYDYSKAIERGVFQDSRVRETCREFICEKVAAGSESMLQEVAGREPVLDYLKSLPNGQTHIALLDSHGQVLQTFESEAQLQNFHRALTSSLEENQRRTIQ